ncbi:MAG TPA: hypothetical protein VL992_19385 [Tepidisphaeraceae bacterium]|nr:hypothetical protein [Tepidisphaeraceae bacterium]
MDELIYILINALIGLFTGKQKNLAPPPTPPRRPANAPPGRPPVRPQQIAPKRPPVPQAKRPLPAAQKRVVVQPVMTRPAAVMPKPTVIARPIAVEAPPPTAHHSFTTINSTVIRRLMLPRTLQTQLVLMEILQPPVALREH